MVPAAYGICARRITAEDGQEPRAELLRCHTVDVLTDLAPLLAEYAAAYGGAPDVLIELDATPTA